jgi:hypothetical protein
MKPKPPHAFPVWGVAVCSGSWWFDLPRLNFHNRPWIQLEQITERHYGLRLLSSELCPAALQSKPAPTLLAVTVPHMPPAHALPVPVDYTPVSWFTSNGRGL